MKENTSSKRLSVIIPVYNALDDVKLCLESILKNFNFEIGEVYIINDCSGRETTEYLNNFATKNTPIKVLKNEENLGFIKTCNKGMKLAKGDIVVLLNSDTKIPAEFCERIIKCFDSDIEIGVASPISSHTCSYYIPLPKHYTIEKMNKLIRQKHKCKYPLIPAAEGFCFCIRKDVIEQQGFLDEIFGKGYHEEVDFAYRAITNGWKNVLIDDLYVYHKRQASFGAETRLKLIEQNNPIFFERWNGFRENYVIKHNLSNPVIEIEKKIFPFKRNRNYDRTPLEFIFSIRNSNDKRHKIITLAGVQVKIKRKKKSQIDLNRVFTKKDQINFKNKRATIFASYNKYCLISENVIRYLTELKNYSDYIIFVCDNQLERSEIKKIENIVDAVICKRHNKYDFGSYKKGFLLLKKENILNNINQILFCNDSVDFVGKSLENIFQQNKYDFYGITQHHYGYGHSEKSKNKYIWIKAPHIQSYFMMVSKQIFRTAEFENFINSIKKMPNKREIIIKYEIGLSKLISGMGYHLNSYYPPTEEDIDLCEKYLNISNNTEEKIFIKRKFYKNQEQYTCLKD